jgi:hypothetical protein
LGLEWSAKGYNIDVRFLFAYAYVRPAKANVELVGDVPLVLGRIPLVF